MLEQAFVQIEKTIWETNEEEALFRLEQCNIYLSHYSHITKATYYLNMAMDLLGLEHSLIGKFVEVLYINFILKFKFV